MYSLIHFIHSVKFQALYNKDYMEAYSHQSLCVTAVGRMLNNQKDENWCLPTMYTVCLDLRLVAQKAETVSSGYNYFF